ncbi:hypothetical protein MMC10_006671 [Thelotrema lepadinum]|nr:hypothetical protein [Thelotrema lepadinum]
MTVRGFEFRLRNKPHMMVGSTFLLVGPGTLELWTTDSEVTKIITGHATFRNFHQSEIMKIASGVFGPSILAANGDDWRRQRRIIAPIINEHISATVWHETVEQAKEMLGHFTGNLDENGRAGVTDRTIEGLRRIAINVLGAAAYGTPRRWIEEDEQAPPGYKLGYINSLLAMGDNFAAALFFPPSLLSLPFLPSSARKVGTAKKEFPRYVDSMIARERATTDVNPNSITSAMIKASDQEKNQQKAATTSSTTLHLTESEIRGNLFIFTLAGFDTTANTLAYALTLLTIHPSLQVWLTDEIDAVFSTAPSPAAYSALFPRLKRCLALMQETLRLYSPIEHLTRTLATPQTLSLSTGTTQKQTQHSLPAGLDIFVSQAGAHVHPDYWGPDPLVFRPQRWITPPDPSSDSLEESLLSPSPGTFLPWSLGPRQCPGMKMSQVEFVGVIATVLREVRLEAVTLPGEKSVEEAKQRLQGVVDGSAPRVTLTMGRPRDVVVRWVRR